MDVSTDDLKTFLNISMKMIPKINLNLNCATIPFKPFPNDPIDTISSVADPIYTIFGITKPFIPLSI